MLSEAKPIESVLARLEGVQKAAGGYMARCPAHDDQKASLSISEGSDGRVLLHCHAGCTVEKIAEGLALPMSGLFPGGPLGGKGKKQAKRERKKELLPDGQYLCRLIGIQEAKTSAGEPLWRLKFIVATGEHRDTWLFDNVSFAPQALPRLKAICEAFGLDAAGEVDLKPAMLEGRTCTLAVEITEYEGLKRNSIPYTGYAPAKEITYDYQDAAGKLLYQVVRLEPKAFYQRRPNGHGGWLYKLEDVKRVPYRLPELLCAAPETLIYIVEGEKDVNRLRGMGLVATTNPQGAGKWDKLDPEAVKGAIAGRRVVIIPDNDEPGQKHAVQVARSVQAFAAEVRILSLPNLPPKGDTSDWLDERPAEHTAQALNALAAAALPWEAKDSSESDGFVITNYESEETTDAQGNRKVIDLRLSLDKILKAITFVCDGWPKRLGQTLFIDQGGEIAMLETEDAFFAYLHERAELRWKYKSDVEGRNFVSRGEIVTALMRRAEQVVETTEIPIHPTPPRVYVTRKFPKSGKTDESYFRKLVSFFRAASPIDEALLVALALTPFWGGEPGTRPLLVVTGPEGIGAQETGKTRAVTLLTSPAGEPFSLRIERSQYADSPTKQLLGDTALRARVVLMDNLSGVTDNNELAELITAPVFDGRPSHGKQRRRSNYLTWAATSVAPQFNRDLASRSFVIHLTPPDRNAWPTFEEDVKAFVREHRERLILDALTLLQGEKAKITAPHSRFPSWDREVLACHYAANDVLSSKVEREHSIDVEDEGLALFLQELKKRCATPPVSFEKEMSPAEITAAWNAATDDEYSVRYVPRKLREFMAKGKLPEGIRPKWGTKHGTPWIVTPTKLFSRNFEDFQDQKGESGDSQVF